MIIRKRLNLKVMKKCIHTMIWPYFLKTKFTYTELKRVVLFIIILVFSLTVEAHKINAYRIIYIDETESIYGTAEILTEYFTSIGFKTTSSNEYDEMSSVDKSELLIATWETDMSQNGGFGEASTAKLILSDVTGTVIYKVLSKGYYGLLHGPKTITRKLFSKIFKQIDKLNYKYDPNLNKVGSVDRKLPFVSWSEDSIKNYLKTKGINSIEGIYKNYSNGLDYYKVAILKEKNKYFGIIVETENKRWNVGDTKIIMSPIEKNSYDVEYYDFKGKRLNSIGRYENRVLTFAVSGDDGLTQTFQFLKVYPSMSSGKNDNTISSDLDLKASGSGFMVSGNIVATNYHVIEEANNIKVLLNTEGSLEEYDAKILSTDKTNDLALIAIKDKKFKSLSSIPYAIASNSVDVGTSIFTMGYPMSDVLGNEVKITDGLISSKTGFNGDAVTYQISAPIQPGNSGGALFDKRGQLVGITNAGIPSADNVGYAIKSTYLLNLIDSAPIDIPLPKGRDLAGKDLPTIIKIYTPYIAFIKIY